MYGSIESIRAKVASHATETRLVLSQEKVDKKTVIQNMLKFFAFRDKQSKIVKSERKTLQKL